jgi:hypothetical protein
MKFEMKQYKRVETSLWADYTPKIEYKQNGDDKEKGYSEKVFESYV